MQQIKRENIHLSCTILLANFPSSKHIYATLGTLYILEQFLNQKNILAHAIGQQ